MDSNRAATRKRLEISAKTPLLQSIKHRRCYLPYCFLREVFFHRRFHRFPPLIPRTLNTGPDKYSPQTVPIARAYRPRPRELWSGQTSFRVLRKPSVANELARGGARNEENRGVGGGWALKEGLECRRKGINPRLQWQAAGHTCPREWSLPRGWMKLFDEHVLLGWQADARLPALCYRRAASCRRWCSPLWHQWQRHSDWTCH